MASEEREVAVIELLRKEPLASNRRIASVLGIAASQVATIIRNFEANNRAHVAAMLDLESFGFSYAYALLRVRNRPVREVADEICAIPAVQFVARIAGNTYDLLVIMRIRTSADFGRLLREEFNNLPGVAGIEAHVMLEMLIYRSEFAVHSHAKGIKAFPAMMATLKAELGTAHLDEVDLIIIAELQIDARRSFEAIARNHGMNAGSVRYRVKNMEKRGLLRFFTIIHPSVADDSAVAFVRLKIVGGKLNQSIPLLHGNDWLPYLFHTSGDFSLCGNVIAKNSADLHRLMEEYINHDTGICLTETLIYTDVFKTELRWGMLNDPASRLIKTGL